MHRIEALAIAGHVGRMLEPLCEDLVVAGSVRRERDDVGDLEFVIRPRMVPRRDDLFGVDLVSAIDADMPHLTRPGSPLQFDPEVKRNGPRLKRLIWKGELVVELFIVFPPASWGSILTIRTGPADYSHLLVTKRLHGGAMPDDLEQRDGALHGPSGRIDTPTEEDFHAALGVPCWPPAGRTAAALSLFLRTGQGGRKDARTFAEAR